MNKNTTAAKTDPLWYKDAIIYEAHVRAFKDSDGDGIGDFRGLTEQLDYLNDLGVTAIWLLPFYPSPLRDDGYDIADYMNIHPRYGTMRDFRTFMREAEKRGIKVITELVVNHTSDQHAWFQRARSAPKNSPYRNFYVWSDTAEEYKEARIIFQDFETSNWTRDPVANSYFWHRFYSHQPDLNYDNPRVGEAVKKVMDYWLGMGVAGMRLDAVPYLFERDGTNCENLPETHQFLKDLRTHIDQKFPGKMLLSEANQWPEDSAAYFGDGDETHMAFHFPLMPRLFMAIRMEDYSPVVDILEQTPPIPENSQWAIFLRNHDELTLEMVTDEERDYMYRIYAHDRAARVNLGIRRRLAPLMNNDRRRIELMNGLLFSLPGTPVIYYGDEIGMGDNFFLGDRNAVRTPMQWSVDRNAGFSRANPQQLFLPVISDPEYHYETINVEVQERNPDSLLWWMRRLIALRKTYKAFSRGTIELLRPGNSKVLAYIRRYEGETILVVANLSRFAQHVVLDVPSLNSHVPNELFGHARFPAIEGDKFSAMLAPYGFYWFSMEPVKPELAVVAEVQDRPQLELTSRRAWDRIFRNEPPSALMDMILEHMRGARWFGGKARIIQSTEFVDAIPIQVGDTMTYFALIKVNYSDGEPETYATSVGLALGDFAKSLEADKPRSLIGRLIVGSGENRQEGYVFDPAYDPSFGRVLLHTIGRRRRITTTKRGTVVGTPTSLFRLHGAGADALEPHLMSAEQSNTSIGYGDRFMLKVYRRPGEGVNPEMEIGRFLLEKTKFTNTSGLAGGIEYIASRGAEPVTLAILNGFVENVGDAWSFTQDQLVQYFERALASPDPLKAPQGASILARDVQPPTNVRDMIGPYLLSARLIGQRTAELHLALASRKDDPAFAPEPFTQLYQRSIYQGVRNSVNQSLRRLRQGVSTLSVTARADVQKIIESQDRIMERIGSLNRTRVSAMRIRNHGDYHLGQLLYTGKDFVTIDFEGEPARPLSERKLKRSPLVDVAGMVRSFHYASYYALHTRFKAMREDQVSDLEEHAKVWYYWVANAFLDEYIRTLDGSPIVPSDPRQFEVLLSANMISKALYEVWYELNNRPDWISIPLRGVQEILESPV